MSEQQAAEAANVDPSDTDSNNDTSSESEESKKSSEDVDAGVQGEITDDQLPADLQPTEDNPLARHPVQTGDEDDQIGQDVESDPETAPLTQDDADYGDGSGGGSADEDSSSADDD